MSGWTAAQAPGAASLFGLLKEEIDHAADMWKKAVTLQYTLDTWVEDTSECASMWLKGVSAIFGGVLPVSGAGEVPGVVFVEDFEAEQADPKTVLIGGIVDAGAPILAQLRQIGTGNNYDANVHIQRVGALLKISLQNLATMDPGHSAGVVYVNEQGGAKMALAHLYVTKLEP